MRNKVPKILLIVLLPGLLAGCVSHYYPAPVIYSDPLAQAPAGDGSGLHSEVLPYTDFSADVSSAEVYPWWSMDYFYLGHGYGRSGFSYSFSSGYPYHDYYYYPPYNHGWHSPYYHDHHHRYYSWHRPYRHHYWHRRYREHHYANHRDHRRDNRDVLDPDHGRRDDRGDTEPVPSLTYNQLVPQAPRQVDPPAGTGAKQTRGKGGRSYMDGPAPTAGLTNTQLTQTAERPASLKVISTDTSPSSLAVRGQASRKEAERVYKTRSGAPPSNPTYLPRAKPQNQAKARSRPTPTPATTKHSQRSRPVSGASSSASPRAKPAKGNKRSHKREG